MNRQPVPLVDGPITCVLAFWVRSALHVELLRSKFCLAAFQVLVFSYISCISTSLLLISIHI